MTGAKRLSPEKLMRALRNNGLTYAEAAQRARRHLPEDARLSHTSIWSYATGRTVPKRLTYIEAIEKALGVKLDGLSDDVDSEDTVLPEEKGAEPQASGDPPAATILVTDGPDNMAHLKMRLSVPWPVALKILEALKIEADGADQS